MRTSARAESRARGERSFSHAAAALALRRAGGRSRGPHRARVRPVAAPRQRTVRRRNRGAGPAAPDGIRSRGVRLAGADLAAPGAETFENPASTRTSLQMIQDELFGDGPEL